MSQGPEYLIGNIREFIPHILRINNDLVVLDFDQLLSTKVTALINPAGDNTKNVHILLEKYIKEFKEWVSQQRFKIIKKAKIQLPNIYAGNLPYPETEIQKIPNLFLLYKKYVEIVQSLEISKCDYILSDADIRKINKSIKTGDNTI